MIGKKVNVSRNIALRILLSALVLVVFNFMANEFYFRLDLTKEKCNSDSLIFIIKIVYKIIDPIFRLRNLSN